MQKTLPVADLSWWVRNLKDNDYLPFGTTSGLIELSDLENFVARAKAQKADCLRVYFMRFATDSIPNDPLPVAGETPRGCKWDFVSKDLTQGTVGIVAAKNFSRDENYIFSADDIHEGENITILFPGVSGEGTGLNPPSGHGVAADITH